MTSVEASEAQGAGPPGRRANLNLPDPVVHARSRCDDAAGSARRLLADSAGALRSSRRLLTASAERLSPGPARTDVVVRVGCEACGGALLDVVDAVQFFLRHPCLCGTS